MKIEAVIFDADGVLQRPAERWRPAFQRLFGLSDARLDPLLSDLLAAETDHLDNENDFRAAVFDILKALGLQTHCDAAMEIFHAIELNDATLDIARRLRGSDLRIFLGSNQQRRRAEHMSVTLGYNRRFDWEFYSCRVGVAKPDPRFFEFILSHAELRGDAVLFIDDRPENVRGALSAGLHAFAFEETEGADALVAKLAKYGVFPP